MPEHLRREEPHAGILVAEARREVPDRPRVPHARRDRLLVPPHLGPRVREPADADAGLYDGFLSDADRRLFPRIRASAPEGLRDFAAQLRDPRCPELLLRYRARNWPGSLDAGERALWNEYRRRRLQRDSGLSEYDFDSYRASIAALRAQHEAGPAQALLDALEDWGRRVEEDLGA